MNLKQTPLTEVHKNLGAKMASFGGFIMPIQYSGIIAEHNWTRTSVSIFDICHMGEFIIQGNFKGSGLDKVVTQNLENMQIGSCRYGFMLNDKGGIIDDLIVYRIEQEEWMLVVNAATIEGDEAHIKNNLNWDAHFKNASNDFAKLDLQGPESINVLGDIVGDEIYGLNYYSFRDFTIGGGEYLISRTGYTGELGYEIYAASTHAQMLWNMFLKDSHVHPAGLGARDTLRLEMGYSLYGQDLTNQISPLEAGMERFIDFDKDFIGKDALIKQRENGLTHNLVGFIVNSRRAPRHNYKILSGNKEIGIVTSGSFSPSIGCGIGMGYVLPEYKNGAKIVIEHGNIEIEAEITAKPFYKKGTARNSQVSFS
ncbi:MAG: glycine cleavage system aminomethyltransferase GcvT [Candidatus Saelkia tenebricola]|nr:glycine cleavage system aminomethyltransferase GcvT [Candidatus Saelkia tenebricola]